MPLKVNHTDVGEMLKGVWSGQVTDLDLCTWLKGSTKLIFMATVHE
jgi:hypothetical protein